MVWNMNSLWKKEEWSDESHFSFHFAFPLIYFYYGVLANEYVIGFERMKNGFLQFCFFSF